MGTNPYRKAKATKLKESFVKLLARGMTPVQAATKLKPAGRSPRWASNTADWIQHDPWVKKEMVIIEEEKRRHRRIEREEVEDIVLEAVDLARSQEVPADMIRGAAELNKMNGFYAPEEQKVVVTGTIAEIQVSMDHMSNAELLQILGEEQHSIDAEFEVLSNTGVTGEDSVLIENTEEEDSALIENTEGDLGQMDMFAELEDLADLEEDVLYAAG